MKLIFGQGPSLSLRLFFAVLLSASLMLADNRLDTFASTRQYLNNIVLPLQYAANLPGDVFDGTYQYINTQQSLVKSNATLKNEVLMLKSDMLLLDQYKEENKRLREILDSPYIRDEKKMISEVMSVNTSIYRQQVLINKGSAEGVYIGQPVINEKGIVGQVANVSLHTSHVILLTDVDSAIPVQVLRNDIRVIASGRGQKQPLHLENIPNGSDIKAGDILVSSGLGGIYPEGYPIGVISEVNGNSKVSFSNISVDPMVDFDRLRYLLLLWPTEDDSNITTNIMSDAPSGASDTDSAKTGESTND